MLVSAGAVLLGAWYIGAWNLIFPSQQHDSQAPRLPADLSQPAILVFSKTNAFRHKDGIAGGLQALQAIGDDRGWSVFATENGAVFNAEQLAQFSAVVFLNATGDMLSKSQESAFESWMAGGGGWLGIHAAGDGSHKSWSWYGQNLIGADFTAHILGPQFQTARVEVEDRDHPVSQDLPASWNHEEEWYSWERSPRVNGFNVVVTIDENSYSPLQKAPGLERDLRMGDHPVVWTNCVGRGKSVYSALGHQSEAFDSPQHRQLLHSALRWLLNPDLACEDAVSSQ
ncbi:ThuA domain-containing protein [Marinobacter alexandrii]|uniref:ThuA domain-containing protein n=1 Tax=Marinobacter alexandrii TaxID=2570351 RepID=UPI003296D8F9